MRLGINQRAAFANVDLGVQVGAFITVGRHPLGNHQVFNRKPIHPDIKIGQQWCIGIAGQQFGQPFKPPAPGCDLANIQPAPQPMQRPPIKADFGNGQEHALGVAYLDRSQHRLAIDIAFNPSDLEAQARCRSGGGNLIGNDTLTDWCSQKPGNQHKRGEQQRQRPPKPLTPAAAL